jgi:hypothetical protein
MAQFLSSGDGRDKNKAIAVTERGRGGDELVVDRDANALERQSEVMLPSELIVESASRTRDGIERFFVGAALLAQDREILNLDLSHRKEIRASPEITARGNDSCRPSFLPGARF